MSGVSGSMGLPVYLSIVKDEQTQVASYVAGDKSLQATAASFVKTAPTLTSATAILKSYSTLQVLTGAYDMSAQIGQTAILRDLMTQNPDSTTSLVQETGDTDYLHFARATGDRPTQTVSLGPSDTLSLSTSGAAATSLTMQNGSWGLASTAQTSAAPGVQWAFVLNDGSAASSIAATLTAAAVAAAASTSTTGSSTPSYTVSDSGVVTGSVGAPAVTTSTDSAGNKVYSLALGTDSAGDVTKRMDVVSVAVAASDTVAGSTAQLTALTGAARAAGFDATLSAGDGLSIVDPATSGTNSLALSYGNAIATATSNTLTPSGQLALGDAGKALSAGQVLLDGSVTLGTVKSVDVQGNVTLTATTTASIAAGDTIQVATGLGLANVGTAISATAATASGGTTLSLGAAGLGLKAGQVVTSGGVTIGTVGRVDSSGTVTLLAGAAAAVASGASLVVTPAVSGGSTPALADASNVGSIVSSFETGSYEAAQDTQYPGMGDALYYTRTMGSVTSIDQLMSNSKLLAVVTTSLGMSSYFGGLDYDQQVSILTKQVNLKTFTSSAGIQRTAEQYLINQASSGSTTPTGLVALLDGDTASDTDMLSLITGASTTTTSSTASDPVLSLFA